ncbi:MAG: adenosine deaminase [Myxococcota bacterium]|jgi:adenosine deaminase|nr:adenosine deaminase [Myxococcota bacterium]
MSYEKIPKVELHRHLEGSLRLSSLIDLAKQHGQELPADTPEALSPYAQVLEPMESLDAVLAAFDLFQNAFRSLEAVERITFEAIEDAARDHVALLELRFSPGFMAQPANLDWDEMMQAILRGVQKATQQYNILVGLIAIVSRSLGPTSARETVAFTLNWRHELVGFDLADAEDAWPAKDFAREIKPLHAIDMPITVHSGENVGPKHIRESIELLQARRIGHGVSLIEDQTLTEQFIENGWALEMCPTSNERTQAVERLSAHPAATLLKRGACVTLNSDDPGLFAITLSGELQRAENEMGFDQGMIEQARQNAISASFIEQKIKNDFFNVQEKS